MKKSEKPKGKWKGGKVEGGRVERWKGGKVEPKNCRIKELQNCRTA
jgi:hypothetical protein